MNTHFEIYLSRFIEWMKAKGWSDRTVTGYTYDVRFFMYYLENETSVHTLTDINVNVLNGFQTYLYHYTGRYGKRLALASQHNKLVAVRSFFRYLYQTDALIYDPSAALNLPRKRKSLPRGLMSEEQVVLLLKQPDLSDPLGFRDRTILETLYATGIRNSELRNLCVYDLDLPQLQLMVRQGKNAKDRVVPIGEIAADFIKEYLLMIRPKFSVDRSLDLLFISKNGLKITQGNLIWIINKYVKAAGFKEHFTPHSLRHSCATHMLRHGADLRYIQEMLGHASVATTQIYTKVETSDLRKMHHLYHPRERKQD